MTKILSHRSKMLGMFMLGLFYMLQVPLTNAATTTPLYGGKTAGTWLWKTTSILSTGLTVTNADKNNVASLIQFCKTKQVTDLYLQINWDLSVTKYKYLVSQLKAARVSIGSTSYPINVQALDGSSTWITADGALRKNDFFDWVIAYQKGATARQRFSAVHLDVEPYGNALWGTDQAAAILAYQNFVTESKTKINQANITNGWMMDLIFDIPFWFDGTIYTNSFGQGNVGEWMYQTVPALAIMSYRDTLNSSYGGIWGVAKAELAYGKIYGKRTILGVEVSPNTPTYITFYEEGEAILRSVLTGLVIKISGDITTTGASYSYAVHDYANWKTMKP